MPSFALSNYTLLEPFMATKANKSSQAITCVKWSKEINVLGTISILITT
jgi:hypothetical protein